MPFRGILGHSCSAFSNNQPAVVPTVIIAIRADAALLDACHHYRSRILGQNGREALASASRRMIFAAASSSFGQRHGHHQARLSYINKAIEYVPGFHY